MPKKFYLDADGKPRYMDDKEYEADQALRARRSGTRVQAREVGVKRAERAKRAESRADIAGRVMQFGIMPGMALADMSQDAVNYIIGKVKGKPTQENARGQSNRDLARRAASGASFGLDKRARAAINTVGDAVSGQSIPQAYKENLAAEQENYRDLSQRTGFAGDVAEFAGGLAAPLGGGGKAVKAINAARTARGGKALGTVASHALGGAVGGGVAGAVEGAARAPDWTDVGNVASQAVQSGAAGAAGGAILGPVAGMIGAGAQKLGRAVVPRSKASELGLRRTERALAEGDLLDEMMGAGHTPARVEQRIADLEAQGAEPRLADVTEFGQRRLKALVDKGAEGVEQARKVLRSRAVRRAGRLRQEMGQAAGVDPFYMSKLDQQAHSAARRAQGAKDYKVGGIMEGAVKLPPSAQAIIDNQVIPNAPTEKIFKEIYQEAVDNLSSNPKLNGLLAKGNKPTRRVVNEMIKIYRSRADMAFRSGNGTTGDALKTQMNVFRDQVKQHNPRMAQMIEKQAKEFAWERASKEGEQLAKHIDAEPEIVLQRLAEFKAGDPHEYEALRSALLGKVMSRVGKDRNSAYAQNLLQRLSDDTQPNHMALWNELLSGGGKSMQTRLSREAMPIATDQRLMGSPTSANMGGMQDLDNALGMAGSAGRLGAGIATGQPAMAASGGLGLFLPAAKAKLQERAGATQRRQLQALTRRVKPGVSLTRMQKRAEQARKVRDAIRRGRYGTGGRGAGYIAGKITEQDQE